MCKEKIYNVIAHSGIWFLGKFFPEYFATDPLRPTDRYIEYPFVLSHLPNPPATVLDVGCSGSMFPLVLKALNYDVFGMDIRKSEFEGVNFTQGSICYNSYPNNAFKVVTAVSTIEHIGLPGRYGVDDYSTDLLALREIHRILEPAGTLLMTVPYGTKFKVTKHHMIYDDKVLEILLRNFSYTKITTEHSPEANYEIALIKATK
jgi:SAM-dependent methyltransferase